MTGSSNVWKLDQDLNILINHNHGGSPSYRGISYNPSTWGKICCIMVSS